MITLTPEAIHAIKCKGPSDAHLLRMLNGYDEKDMPDSRHVRWMAAKILTSLGYELYTPERKRNAHKRAGRSVS